MEISNSITHTILIKKIGALIQQQNNENNRATPPDYKTEPVYSIRFPVVESRGAFVQSRPGIEITTCPKSSFSHLI
jgi:hypothetical protein